MTPAEFNNWRIFPRIGMIFMSAMFIWFNNWFFQVSVNDMPEYALVQYGLVVGTYVGLWKFYFETGKIINHD